MIIIKVDKLEMSGIYCSNINCKHLPEYHFKLFDRVYHIKTGTVCAFIRLTSGDQTDIYCTDCIDEIYNICKSKLNKDLWAFH